MIGILAYLLASSSNTVILSHDNCFLYTTIQDVDTEDLSEFVPLGLRDEVFMVRKGHMKRPAMPIYFPGGVHNRKELLNVIQHVLRIYSSVRIYSSGRDIL